MRKFLTIAVLLLLSVAARGGPVVYDAHVEAELIAKTKSITPGQPLVVGVRLAMDEHWHTYWQNPGDSGLVTQIFWNVPDGFVPGEIEWPTPDQFTMEGLVNYGYSDEIVLPVTIQTPADLEPDTRITLSAHVTWLACEKACIPGKADLSVTLPVSADASAEDVRWRELFAWSDARQPMAIDASRVSAQAAADGNISLTVTGIADETGIYFFPSEASTFTYQPKQTVSQNTILLNKSKYAKDVTQVRGVLQVGEHYWQIDTPVTPPTNIALLMVYAILGGMLLNLMPCVFPVLSIKILGFVNQAGEDQGRILKHGLAFGAGVIGSFWVLVAALLALRAGGEQLGWGFQLQEPGFVAVMALLMFLVGLNFIGAFDFGIGVMNAAGKAQVKVESGYTGSLLSGVLAVAIATPCTAPFMGPAIGLGLTLPVAQTVMVFTALGAGMALPYVLLSAFPGWLKVLPKPGAWMETFKQVMAFPMFGATIWLVWVFGQQVGGGHGMMLLLIGLLSAGIGAWVLGRWRGKPSKVVAVVFVALALAVPFVTIRSFAGGDVELTWQTWSEQAVTDAQSAGRPVFVDFTADWCLTCKFNESTVLARADVAAAFAAHDVALLKADWTSRDEAITAALARFDRAGVPLYVVYPADRSADPIVLPTVITREMVIETVNEVASPLALRGSGGL